MDDDLWTQFELTTDHFVNFYANLTNLKIDSIYFVKELNFIWTALRDSIIKAAKDIIPSYKVANNSTQRFLKPITQLQLDIKKVNQIYYSFKTSNIKFSNWPSDLQWVIMIGHLNTIIKACQIPALSPFVSYLNSDNILIKKKKVYRLLQ